MTIRNKYVRKISRNLYKAFLITKIQFVQCHDGKIKSFCVTNSVDQKDWNQKQRKLGKNILGV